MSDDTPTPEDVEELADAMEGVASDPTLSDRDAAEGVARLCRLRCKHEAGACLECMIAELTRIETRRRERREERLREDLRMKINPPESPMPTSRQKRRARIGCALILAAFPAWWVFSSWQEASTYAKLTGKEVSTWDAMWVELRVQEGAQD